MIYFSIAVVQYQMAEQTVCVYFCINQQDTEYSAAYVHRDVTVHTHASDYARTFMVISYVNVTSRG